MRRLALLMLFLALPAAAAAAEPRVRASLEEPGPFVPGQQIHIDVEVLVPDFFTSPPQFPLFDVPDAVVTLPDERAQNLVETVDGVQYSGIRRRYAVVPEVPGSFTTPAATVTFRYSVDGKATEGSVAVPPLNFVVQNGTANASMTFAARNLTVAESFDRDTSKLQSGDAVVRTVTLSAEDTQAMMMPPIAFGDVSGLRAYRKPPVIRDGITHGSRLVSTRIETVTYTADANGVFLLPPVSYAWFDLDGHHQEVAVLPATTLIFGTESPTSGGGMTVSPEDGPHLSVVLHWKLVVAGVVVVLFLLQIVFRHLPRSRLRALEPREEALQALMSAARGSDLMAIYSALAALAAADGFWSVGAWIAAVGSSELSAQVRNLEQELFGKPTGPTFDVQRLRNALRAGSLPSKSHSRRSALPKLNPVSESGHE